MIFGFMKPSPPKNYSIANKKTYMKKKYVVVGGKIMSKSDGDIHHIPAPVLAKLYGLDPRDCVLTDESKPDYETTRRNYSGHTVLFPRYDGNYTLPAPKL